MAAPPLFREPYRVLFPLAMLHGVGLIGLWGAQLATGDGHLSIQDHGSLMLWGVYGTAVLGFLATAYPKQNDAAQPGGAAVVALAVAQVGLVVAWLAGQPLVGAALGVLTWATVAVWAGRIARASLARKWDPTSAAAPLAIAVGAVAIGLAGTGREPVLAAALAVHASLVPLALALLDRLLPFFSRRVPGYDGLRRPGFALTLVGLGLARALVERYLPAATAVVDVALLALLGRQWHGWRPLQGLKPPLLGVLHLGTAWILLGYLVDAVAPWLGLAPSVARHLWLVGGLGTLVFGISVRVTRGHGGLPLVLGLDGAILIGLVQLAVVLRGVLPLFGVAHPALYPAAATALGLAFLGWLVRLGPAVLR